jgi:DNA-binding winged helix-turn-helix (wHTH) protein/tetratricopeptide (TPR) repeat protein
MKGTLPQRVRLGVFEVDLRAGELRQDEGAVLVLPDQPLQILRMLIEADGEIVTRDEIRQRLWPNDTVVEFDLGINTAIKKLRRALVDSGDEPHYIGTIAKRGYRLLVPVERVGTAKDDASDSRRTADPSAPSAADSARDDKLENPRQAGETGVAVRAPAVGLVAESLQPSIAQSPRHSRWKWAAAAVLVVAAAIAGTLYWRAHRAPKLTERDTIVLADFDNKTGDPVFDDALQQALSIQLEQSPFLNVLSDRKVRATLKLMNRAGEPLSEDVSREICIRTSSKATLVGSIAASGHEYVIDLRAVSCDLGNSIAEVRERAADKQGVLTAVDKAAKQLRNKLGESLGSIDRYAVPLQEATTPSLDALRAYSMGWKTRMTNGSRAAIPFYQRAIEIDPNFAIAYNALALAYRNVNDFQGDGENTRKAYQLRDRTSERERFAIQANYYLVVTGELDKAAQTYELWQSRYPGDPRPVAGLGNVYSGLGNMEKYLEQARAVMRLDPNFYPVYENLANAYEKLNRLDEAEEVLKQAEQRHLGGPALLMDRYELAFLKGDRAEMTELAAALKKVPGFEDPLFAMLGDIEAWYGRFKTAQGLGRQAVEFAERNNDNETAAFYLAMQALSRVPAGNGLEARADAAAALKLSQSLNVKATGALALALAGDVAAAKTLAAELDKAFPLSTGVQRNWLPTIEAAIALQAKQGDYAIHVLEKTSAVELGEFAPVAYLCPAYVRGEAYLMVGDGQAAAREFHKFIDHYGNVSFFTWGALARLGLARAYALEAQTDPAAREKARTAYQNFLTLWKDADPDIPIYQQAKAEYAKLQ